MPSGVWCLGHHAPVQWWDLDDFEAENGGRFVSMMKRAIFLLVTLAACDTAPPAYCDDDGTDTRWVGAWWATPTETGGDCGPLPVDLFIYPQRGLGANLDGIEVNWGGIVGYECDGPARGVMLHSGPDGVQSTITFGPVMQLNVIRLIGWFSVTQRNLDGDTLCSSDYVVNMEVADNVAVPP